MNMKFVKKMLQKTASMLNGANLLRAARLPLPTSPAARDAVRAAMAGTILFGIAGAGLGARGGFNAFKVDPGAAGATVSVVWGQVWLVWAAAGMATGAFAGALVSYLANFKQRGGATALLAVGAIGGILAGASWGSAVARERVVHVRAQPAIAKPISPNDGPTVSVVNGPIRLSGSVDRDINFPLFGFMLLGGTVVGALAARGLGESNYSRSGETLVSGNNGPARHQGRSDRPTRAAHPVG
jgi:hypothetical protein